MEKQIAEAILTLEPPDAPANILGKVKEELDHVERAEKFLQVFARRLRDQFLEELANGVQVDLERLKEEPSGWDLPVGDQYLETSEQESDYGTDSDYGVTRAPHVPAERKMVDTPAVLPLLLPKNPIPGPRPLEYRMDPRNEEHDQISMSQCIQDNCTEHPHDQGKSLARNLLSCRYLYYPQAARDIIVVLCKL